MKLSASFSWTSGLSREKKFCTMMHVFQARNASRVSISLHTAKSKLCKDCKIQNPKSTRPLGQILVCQIKNGDRVNESKIQNNFGLTGQWSGRCMAFTVILRFLITIRAWTRQSARPRSCQKMKQKPLFYLWIARKACSLLFFGGHVLSTWYLEVRQGQRKQHQYLHHHNNNNTGLNPSASAVLKLINTF